MFLRRIILLSALLSMPWIVQVVSLPSFAQQDDAEEPLDEATQQSAEEDEKSNDKEEKVDKKKGKKQDKLSRKERNQLIENLPEQYQFWLQSVDLLISRQEIDIFLELGKDYQRDAFIERFWQARDPYPDTPTNEFREGYEKRVAQATELFGRLDEDRAIILLLNDYPDARIEINCVELWKSEVWYWKRNQNVGEVALLFYQVGGGMARFKIWYPSDGIGALLKFPSGSDAFQAIQSACSYQDVEAIVAVLRMAGANSGMGFASLVSDMMRTPDLPTKEWIATFHAYSTEVPDDALTFPAELAIEYPSRHQSRTVVQGLLTVPIAEAQISQLTDYGNTYNFLLLGEVLRDDRLFDTFRYQFNLPHDEVLSSEIPLVFERYLRPGDYNLVLKLEDLNSGKFFHQSEPLAVPTIDFSQPTEPADPETARLLAEANAAISTGEHTIKIVDPRGQYQTGMIRIDTLTTGKEIDEVAFELDGRDLLVKHNPPWSVEFDLGSLPNVHTVSVTAFDAAGTELARDEQEFNASAHRFDVNLIEPRRNKSYDRSLRAEAEIDVPEGGVVDKVEFYLNETLKATLYQPPWTQPIMLDTAGELAYVRAVAYQPDGNFTEDTGLRQRARLPRGGRHPVRRALHRGSRTRRQAPGHGPERGRLPGSSRTASSQDADALRSGRQPADPRRHPGRRVGFDGPQSMDMAQKGALQFFEQAITPKDRATLITFNDHPHLATKFTNDVSGALAGGLAGSQGRARHRALRQPDLRALLLQRHQGAAGLDFALRRQRRAQRFRLGRHSRLRATCRCLDLLDRSRTGQEEDERCPKEAGQTGRGNRWAYLLCRFS